MDLAFEEFQNNQLKDGLFLRIVQDNLEDVIENFLVFEPEDEEDLVVGIGRVEGMGLFVKDCDIDFAVIKKLLFGDILKGVQQMGARVLQCFTIINLIIKLLNMRVYLGLPQLDFLFPPLHTVELLVIFAEIKTTIIQALDIIFIGHIFAGFIELLFALVELLDFLLQAGQDDMLGDLGLGEHDGEHVLVGVNFSEEFLEQR